MRRAGPTAESRSRRTGPTAPGQKAKISLFLLLSNIRQEEEGERASPVLHLAAPAPAALRLQDGDDVDDESGESGRRRESKSSGRGCPSVT